MGYSQFHQHLSNLRKVLTFLKTLYPNCPSLISHIERLSPFLSTLSIQLKYQFPKREKSPTLWDLIKQWADLLVVECNVLLKLPPVMLTRTQAFFIQSTIMALIIVGRYTPPLRAGIIRDLQHPSKVSSVALTWPASSPCILTLHPPFLTLSLTSR